MARFNRGHRGPLTRISAPPTVIELGTTANATANATTVTSASFTPAPSSLLVAFCAMGNGTGTGSSVGAVTDSAGGTWTRLVGNASTSGGVAEIWVRDAGGSPSAMTVTYDPGGAGASGLDLIVKWYNAVAVVAQTGVTAAPAGSTSYTASITTTMRGSLVVGALGRATDAATPTANAATTLLGSVNGSSGDTAAVFRASALTGDPGSVTLGFTNVASGTNWFALAEILPVATSPDLTGGGSDVPVSVGAASGTGAAFDASLDSAPALAAASGTGTAFDMTVDIRPAVGTATATGTAPNAQAGIGAQAESADGYGTRFVDGFAGISTGPVWADMVIHGQWYQTPSGNQTVQIVEQSSTKYLRVSAEPIGGGAGTFAGLALSRDTFSNWSTLAVEYITDTQHRTPTPNRWEVGWTFFNFTDNNHFYYVLLCPDGYWELGKEWTDGVTQFQDFLAFGTAGVTWPLGDRLRVEVDQVISGTSVTFNFRAKDITRGDVSYQTLVTGFTDDGTRPSGPANLTGQLGLYVEDSAARFATVELNSPHILDATLATTATPATATAAGAAPDLAAAVTIPVGVAAGTGTAHDAQTGLGPLPGAATGTGTAYDFDHLNVTFGVETASAAGTAPDVQAGVGALAGAATGTGTASDLDHVDVTVASGVATAAGSAADATVALTVSAEAASGVGTAFDAATAAGVLAEAATAIGAAWDALVASSVNVDQATGAGTSYDVIVSGSSNTNVPVETASGTGAAYDVGVDIGPAVAVATASGTAPDAAVGVGAQPGTANAAGTALDLSSAITVDAGLATAVGTAWDALTALAVSVGTAAGAGAASDASVAATANVEQATGAGAAYDVTVSTSAATAVPVEAATAAGAAFDVTILIGPAVETAVSVGTASDTSVDLAVLAQLASAAGSAYDVSTRYRITPRPYAGTTIRPYAGTTSRP